MLNWELIATEFAEVLLRHEPVKVDGGSVERREWLALMLTIHKEMLGHNVHEEFVRVLEGTPWQRGSAYVSEE